MSFLIGIVLLFGIIGMIRFAVTEGPAFVWYTLTRLAVAPFMPFLIAHRIKKGKPVMSKALVILWSLVYLVIGFTILLYWKTS